MDKEVVQGAVSRLANTMRMYVEAHVRYRGLVAIDKEEAIDNLDRAFEAKLEAFHTLYDVSKKAFDYFRHADTALLIALRNALHHRDHALFGSLLPELWLKGDPERLHGAAYLLARHPSKQGIPSSMYHFIKLEDIYSRLDPRKGSPDLLQFGKGADAERRFELWESGLALKQIWAEAQAERYPDDQVYLDVMPIFISGVCRTLTSLKAKGVEFKGFDAGVYEGCFTSELEVDLSTLDFKMLRMNLAQLTFGPALTISQAAAKYARKGQSFTEDEESGLMPEF